MIKGVEKLVCYGYACKYIFSVASIVFDKLGYFSVKNTALLASKQGLGEGQGKEGIKRRRL